MIERGEGGKIVNIAPCSRFREASPCPATPSERRRNATHQSARERSGLRVASTSMQSRRDTCRRQHEGVAWIPVRSRQTRKAHSSGTLGNATGSGGRRDLSIIRVPRNYMRTVTPPSCRWRAGWAAKGLGMGTRSRKRSRSPVSAGLSRITARGRIRTARWTRCATAAGCFGAGAVATCSAGAGAWSGSICCGRRFMSCRWSLSHSTPHRASRAFRKRACLK